VTEVVGAAADVVAVMTCAVSVAVAGAGVAACACREDTSKTAKIPKAKIANCIARRAMCRKIGWDISSSRAVGGMQRTYICFPP
jgi:hypothetical protein